MSRNSVMVTITDVFFITVILFVTLSALWYVCQPDEQPKYSLPQDVQPTLDQHK